MTEKPNSTRTIYEVATTYDGEVVMVEVDVTARAKTVKKASKRRGYDGYLNGEGPVSRYTQTAKPDEVDFARADAKQRFIKRRAAKIGYLEQQIEQLRAEMDAAAKLPE